MQVLSSYVYNLKEALASVAEVICSSQVSVLSQCVQRETENQNSFSNVYTLLDLDEPSAKSIRDLDTIMGELQGHCAEQHQHALVTETQKYCINIGKHFRWAGVRSQPSALHQEAGALGCSSPVPCCCNQGPLRLDARALRRVLAFS